MTADDGLVGRMMKGSVDRALRMQPGRVTRVADDLLYASPSQRDVVAEFADAGRRLVEGILAPRTLGVIAVRRTETSASRTAPGADLTQIDNRTLESIDLTGDSRLVEALTHGHAVIVAWPPALLAVGVHLDAPLSIARHLPVIDSHVGSDRLVLGDDGSCVAIADSIGAAITWLEVGEHVAHMQLRRSS